MPQHTIQQGECITTIADQYGLTWEVIWTDSANKSLHDTREDPNVLLPGDVLTIPELRKRGESAGTEVRHRFRRLGTRAKFRLNIKVRTVDDEEQAIVNEAYKIEFDSGDSVEAETDGDGLVEATLPAGVRSADILFERLNLTLPVAFGHMNPVDEASGVQGRLNMLGFPCGAVDGDAGPLTNVAVKAYQKKKELTVDGVVGPETKAKLKEDFGS